MRYKQSSVRRLVHGPEDLHCKTWGKMTNNMKSNKGRVPGQIRENRFISAVKELLQQENISDEEVEAQPFIRCRKQGGTLEMKKRCLFSTSCIFILSISSSSSGSMILCFGESDLYVCVCGCVLPVTGWLSCILASQGRWGTWGWVWASRGHSSWSPSARPSAPASSLALRSAPAWCCPPRRTGPGRTCSGPITSRPWINARFARMSLKRDGDENVCRVLRSMGGSVVSR